MYKVTFILIIAVLWTGCTPHNHHPNSDLPQTAKPLANSPKKEVYYTCSMHPRIRESQPGKCPICKMNLTKVEKIHEHDHTPSKSGNPPSNLSPTNAIAKVRLSKSQLKHFRATLFPAAKMQMSKSLRILGRLKSAEEKLSTIAARFPARVEKVFVESVGSYVKEGDPVVQVYSPELLTAGEELILSAAKVDKKNDFGQLYKKAREKLLLWGIRPSQINKWTKSGKVPEKVTLYAKSSGTVRKRVAIPGKYFKEGENYFELSDLSHLWAEMDVYEHDSNWIKLGQSVSLDFVAIPGKQKSGQIDFISPTIDEKTRTLKIRSTIPNPDGALKPGMVAQGTLRVILDGEPIVVPTSAIIDTGNRKVVWLEEKKDKYIARPIRTGFLADGYTEIISGLKEGERVVIDGNFLLDAQAQLYGGYEDFNTGTSAKPHHGHNH